MKDHMSADVEAILRELNIPIPNAHDDELPPLPETTDGPASNEEPPTPEQMDAIQEPTELIEGEVVEDPPEQLGLPVWWILPISLIALAAAIVVVVFILPMMKESASVIITPD